MKHTEVKKIDGGNRLVRSNEFASAAYTLPPDAHRILSVAISMIRQKDEQLHTYRIYTRKLIEFFPALHSDKNAIARLDSATDALMGSYTKIRKKSGWIKRNLIHSCQLNKNDGNPYVDIRLDDDMLPFLIGLTGGFSAPKIENIRFFKKENHFKLYAFFHAHLYRGNTGEVPLSQIRELLSIEKRQYKLVGHLKSRLLDPSIELINRTTDIHITYSAYKHGRKVAGFIFDIQKQSLQRTAAVTTPSLPTSAPTNSSNTDLSLSGRYSALGITGSEFKLIQDKLGNEYLEQLLHYVADKKRRNQIQSEKRYLFGIIKKSPPIEELSTPASIQEKRALQAKQLEAEQSRIEQQHHAALKQEGDAITTAAEQYIGKLTESNLQQLKEEFNLAPHAKGLKFGEKRVDFDNKLVDATFKRYVYCKHLHPESRDYRQLPGTDCESQGATGVDWLVSHHAVATGA